jgi:hypothetical protein
MYHKYSISYFEKITQRKGVETNLLDVFNSIKNGVYKKQIEKLRSLTGVEAAKAKEQLPCFTPSGLFSVRNKQGLTNYSNIVCLDFDDLENPTDVKEALSLYDIVFAAFISPSGTGVKCFIKSNNSEQHEAVYIALLNYFEKELGIRGDEKCKDVSRVCFVGHDAELFLNEDSGFCKLEENQLNNSTNREQLKFEIETVTQRIEANGVDITNGYANWLKLGFALSNAIGEEGRQFYHRLSTFNSNYDSISTDKQYTECLKDRKSGVTYRAFFWLAKENGVDIKIIAAPPSPTPQNKHHTTSFKNLHGEEITDRERIELSISEDWEVRNNIVFNRVECREKNKEGTMWCIANEHNISRKLELKRVKNCGPNKIKSILCSDFVPLFNPFISYFESLPAYDKKEQPDYIQLLANIVQLTNEKEDRERFNKNFKKALVRSVACSIWDKGDNNLNYNKHAIIFINPKQSIGKSGFIRFIMPKELENYFVEHMEWGNRDEQIISMSSFIVNLDEMGSIDVKNIPTVKSAISRSAINIREIGGGGRINSTRRTNFWGNTNDTSILKDDTGNVRFITFEAEGFNKELEYWKETSPLHVDINRVWAQAYSLFNEGFNFQLTKAEINENELINERYKEISVEEELVMKHFKKPIIEDKQNCKTATEVHIFLSTKHPALSSRININKLGAVLRRNFIRTNKHEKLKNNSVYAYCMEEL